MPLSASAGDWTRLKRLHGAKTYATTIVQNTDILNTVTLANPFNPETLQSRVVGSSKTRREVSKWTDYVASQNETYLQKNVDYQNSPFVGTRIRQTRLCSCITTVLDPRSTGCINCRYN